MYINFSEIAFQSLFQSFQLIWPLYTLLLIVVIGKLVLLFYKHYQFSTAGIFEIDHMSGDDFEKFLAILFEKLGYATKIVGSNKGDYGADLIIEKQGERTVVQAKCWHNSVGVKAVQEVYGSLHMHSCTKACVVTNNYFTEQAKRLAEANNVELWDRNTLAKIILSTKKR